MLSLQHWFLRSDPKKRLKTEEKKGYILHFKNAKCKDRNAILDDSMRIFGELQRMSFE